MGGCIKKKTRHTNSDRKEKYQKNPTAKAKSSLPQLQLEFWMSISPQEHTGVYHFNTLGS